MERGSDGPGHDPEALASPFSHGALAAGGPARDGTMIARLIVARLALAALTLLVVSAFIFWTAEVLPGDVALRVLGRETTEEQRQAFRQRLHLDWPVYARYGLWLQGALRGDFGTALTSQRPVAEVIALPLRNTLVLGLYAFLLYIPISLVLATLGALFRDRPLDAAISLFTLVGLALPEFVLGTGLLLLLAVVLPLFPAMSLVDPNASPLDALRAITLPAITLAIAMAVYAIRMLRDNLIEVLDSDYVRMAVLNGLPRARVVLRHALPNALVPALNVTALNLAYLIGGVVVVERVFAYPGLGSLLVDAISLRDATVIEAAALVVSAVYILANLFADVMAILLNPRLRTS